MGFRDKAQAIRAVPLQVKNVSILAVIACIIASIALLVVIAKVSR